MADKGTDAADRPPERQRIRKLAQAALNADVTVEQVDTILAGMGGALTDLDRTLGDLDSTIDTFDATLTRLSTTLDRVDATAERMAGVVERLERVVGRVERLVGIGETAMRPLGAIESAGRGVAGLIGFRSGR
ncbi:hypothetical protein [Gordonia soli]|uniref:ATPase n=1 Tax=Gordonia soli NBRC 108243 TaxID=1223545 RepID=M0QRG0_9ACTN|nr:hypothetical protein [Gordonia soli]GAC70901.1 hypothetical protein GS4_43_00270 [Gordonia soli NBRC 108243]